MWNSKVSQRAPDRISELVSDALAFDKRIEFEETYGVKTVWLTLTPVTLEGYVNVYIIDITERKKAEEAVKFQADLLNHEGKLS